MMWNYYDRTRRYILADDILEGRLRQYPQKEKFLACWTKAGGTAFQNSIDGLWMRTMCLNFVTGC